MLGKYETQPHDFIIAVETGNIKNARNLLKNGVDPNLKNEAGEPPIFVAIRNNDKAMLRLLLENKADVNFKNSKGYTILMFCLASNKIDLAKELLQKGALADFNFRYSGGKTALMIAISSKDRRFVKSILKFKQNLDLRDFCRDERHRKGTSRKRCGQINRRKRRKNRARHRGSKKFELHKNDSQQIDAFNRRD